MSNQRWIVLAGLGFALSCGGADGASEPSAAALDVSPLSQTLFVGLSLQLEARVVGKLGAIPDANVSWSSSASAIARVAGNGVNATVTAMGPGVATITASYGGQRGTTVITVSNVPVYAVTITPKPVTVAAGFTQQLTADTRDAAGVSLSGRPVAWSAQNPAVATVSSSGLVTGVSVGSTQVVATSEGRTDSAPVTVIQAPVASVTVVPAAADVEIGRTTTLATTLKDANGNVLTGRPVTWNTSDSMTATVSSSGVVTAIATGAVTITATSEGITGTASVRVIPVPIATITVNPGTASLIVGQPGVQLTAVARDAAGNVLAGRPITWSSSNEGVASVNTGGTVVPVAAGSTTITATAEGKSGTASVTVASLPPSIVLSSTSLSFSATQGGPNPASQSVTITNNGSGSLSGLSIGVVTYGAGASGWLQTPSLSSTTANPSATLTIQPIAAGLTQGSYTVAVSVLSSVAANSPRTLTITFVIGPPPAAPTISMPVQGAVLTSTEGGPNPLRVAIPITNGGTGTLSGLSVGQIAYQGPLTGWLQATLTGTTAQPTDTVILQGITGSLPHGTYQATVPIQSSAASNSPQNLSVVFDVNSPPANGPTISLSSTTLNFVATQGGANPVSQTVTITNSGTGTLSGLTVGAISYVNGAAGWLSASLNTSTAAPSATLTAQPSVGTLTQGIYTATIPLTSAVASNSPRNVAVTLTVNGPTVATLSVQLPGTGNATVSGSPGAINCSRDVNGVYSGTCTYDYIPNTQVTLTAAANFGATFDGWGGACTGTAATCNLTMNTSKVATATMTNHLPPTPTTTAATNVTSTSATINGCVPGVTISTTATFQWSSNSDIGQPEVGQTPVPTDNVQHCFSFSLSNLIHAHTYIYRILARNSYGVSVGSVLNFTTQP